MFEESGFFKFINLIKTPDFFVFWFAVFFFLSLFADQRVAFFVYHLNSPWLINVAAIVTQLGLSDFYIVISLLLFFIGFAWQKKRLWQGSVFVFASVVSSGITCDVIKIIFGRARPYELTLHQIYGFNVWQFSNDFWSFPSGHVTTITAVAVALSYLFPRYWRLLFLLVILVAMSRVLLSMHFLSDVWGGFYLGAWVTLLVHSCLQKKGLIPQESKI